MLKKYTIEFDCYYDENLNSKQKLINEIETYFQTISGLSLIFERKILPELELHPFDGSTCSYHSKSEGISFYFFTDILSGKIDITLNPKDK